MCFFTLLLSNQMFALEVAAQRKDLVGYCILDLRTAQMNGTKVKIFKRNYD